MFVPLPQLCIAFSSMLESWLGLYPDLLTYHLRQASSCSEHILYNILNYFAH